MAAFRSRLVALAVACAYPIGVAGQAKTELVLGPLVSVQPEGETGRPYLDNGLGGTEPGMFLGIARRTKGGFLLALIDTSLNYTLPQELLKFRDAFTFSLVILILLWRPAGLIRGPAPGRRT